MMFLFHLAGLVYGLAALVMHYVRTSSDWWDAAPLPAMQFADTYFPTSIFQPWKTGTTAELEPSCTRTALVGGGLALYCLRYLFSKHRA